MNKSLLRLASLSTPTSLTISPSTHPSTHSNKYLLKQCLLCTTYYIKKINMEKQGPLLTELTFKSIFSSGQYHVKQQFLTQGCDAFEDHTMLSQGSHYQMNCTLVIYIRFVTAAKLQLRRSNELMSWLGSPRHEELFSVTALGRVSVNQPGKWIFHSSLLTKAYHGSNSTTFTV